MQPDLRSVYRLPPELPEPHLRILSQLYGAERDDHLVIVPDMETAVRLVRHFAGPPHPILSSLIHSLEHVSGPAYPWAFRAVRRHPASRASSAWLPPRLLLERGGG